MLEKLCLNVHIYFFDLHFVKERYPKITKVLHRTNKVYFDVGVVHKQFSLS